MGEERDLEKWEMGAARRGEGPEEWARVSSVYILIVKNRAYMSSPTVSGLGHFNRHGPF